MKQMQKLRQTSTAAAHKSQFEALSNWLEHILAHTKLSCFIGGLKDEIRYLVKLLNPNTLNQAFGTIKTPEEFVIS